MCKRTDEAIKAIQEAEHQLHQNMIITTTAIMAIQEDPAQEDKLDLKDFKLDLKKETI